MNILSIATSFTGLFPSKLTITLIDAISGTVVLTYKANKAALSTPLTKPTTIIVSGEEWRIVKLVPENPAEYLRKKKVTIYIVDASNEAKFPINNLVPTKVEIPELVHGSPSDQHLVMQPYSWRQLEFVRAALLSAVTEEFTSIEQIVSEGTLLGYDSCHIRATSNIPHYRLSIVELLNITSGTISESVYLQNCGFVKHSFHLKSEDNSYYGILQDNDITLLCLEKFDAVNEELMNVLTHFELILVDWCHPQAIS